MLGNLVWLIKREKVIILILLVAYREYFIIIECIPFSYEPQILKLTFKYRRFK